MATNSSQNNGPGYPIQLINAILHSRSHYRALLRTRGEKAQKLLDILQKVLDSDRAPEELRPSVLYAIMRLCRETSAYPEVLTLWGVTINTEFPVTSGRFGDIWRGMYQNDAVSVKTARLNQQSNVEQLRKNFAKEAIVWNYLEHPNVLPFYGVFCMPDDRFGRLCLVSPWMSNGNIRDYLNANPEFPRLLLVTDILAGLKYLHDQKIVHGDLKSANILVNSAGSACLADFGLSSVADATILRWSSLETMAQIGGTIRWEAPELLDYLEDGSVPRPTCACDIYSLASVMYEILTGRIPYYEFPREVTVLAMITRGQLPSKPSANIDLELTDEIWNIMKLCWTSKPDERPTIDNVTQAMDKIEPNFVTKGRITERNGNRGRSAPVKKLTSRTFRSAIRGNNANFSEAEIRLLSEHFKTYRDPPVQSTAQSSVPYRNREGMQNVLIQPAPDIDIRCGKWPPRITIRDGAAGLING